MATRVAGTVDLSSNEANSVLTCGVSLFSRAWAELSSESAESFPAINPLSNVLSTTLIVGCVAAG